MAINSKEPKWKVELNKAAQNLAKERQKNIVDEFLDNKILEIHKQKLAEKKQRQNQIDVNKTSTYQKFEPVYIDEFNEIEIIRIIKENQCAVEIICKVTELKIRKERIYDKHGKFDCRHDFLFTNMQLDNSYLKVAEQWKEFDSKYGTEHFEKRTDRTESERIKGFGENIYRKSQIHLLITMDKRQEMLKRFEASETGKIYSQIKASSLYTEITKKLDVSVCEAMRKEFDNEHLEMNLGFEVLTQSVSQVLPHVASASWNLQYHDLGYGKMSERAQYVIALLVYEYAIKCCKNSNLCKRVSGKIGICWSGIVSIRFNIEIKPNNTRKAW